MAGKRGRPKKKPEVVKEEESVKEIAEETIVPKEELTKDPEMIRKYRIRYDTNMEEREFVEHGNKVVKDQNGIRDKVPQLSREIRLKAGQEMILTEEEFYYLYDKGLILDNAKLVVVNQVRGDLMKVKSGREEPKKEMQIISDEDKRKIFIHLPKLIEVIEEPAPEEE
jgi:hypothetical protein